VKTRGIARRLRRLETAPTCARAQEPVVFVVDYASRALEPGEFAAIDWIRNSGGLIWARERITEDPTDKGRPIELGTYIKDALQEIHERCEYRDLPGGCALCRNTPIAAPLTVESEETESRGDE